MMIWDLCAGAMCVTMSACMFWVFQYSAPKRKAWISFPLDLRVAFFVVGGTFLGRGVNFLTLAPAPAEKAGHINAWGLMASMAMTYVVVRGSVKLFRFSLKAQGWDRLAYAAKIEREQPGATPVMMSPEDVLDMHRAQGVPTLSPMAPPSAVVAMPSQEIH